MELIASTDHFALFDRPDFAQGEWRSLKLERTDSKGQKRNWWLGWNGERFARNADAGKLAEHHPDVYDWVISSLKGAEHDQRRAG
jgi:hypothetical protein